jgi:PAS domain S-box-containing protein
MDWKSASAQSLIEAVPDALVGVDEAGVIQFVNSQTQALFGYGPGDLIGEPLETLVPQTLRTGHIAHRASYIADPRIRPMGTDMHLVGLRRDGTEFPVDIALSYVKNEDGMVVIAAVRDMTRYQRAEDDRRRANQLLTVVEGSDDAIIGTTLDGIVTSWNRAAERIFGYSREEIMGRSVQPLIPEDRADEMPAILAAIFAGHHVDHFESARIRKDGTVLTVALGVSAIRDTASEIVGLSTTARNVSEAKQAFEAARSMMEASLDSLVAISPDGKITDANQATVTLTGVPRARLIGSDFSQYFTDPAKAEELYQKALTEGITGGHRLTLRHHNGRDTRAEVLYNATVHRDANGNALAVFATARDVTEEARAFEAARSMIEASLDSLVAISPEGKITDANQATVRLTGVPREELIGTNFSQYFTEPAQAEAIYQHVQSEGAVSDYPLTLRRRNGHDTFTEVRYNASVYRDEDGEMLGVFAAARDVTDQMVAQREVAEQQSRAQARLEELERFQRLIVGRELKMIALKKEIEYLHREAPGDPDDPDDSSQHD